MEKIYSEYNVRGQFKRYTSFDRIDSHDDAYLIGYLACDGGYVVNGGFPFMMVSSIQPKIIEHFQQTYCPDATIYNIGQKSSEKVNATNDVWELRFPAKMAKTFNRFGVFNYKLNRRVVGIPNKFFGGYIRGVIDADGFITVTHRKDCRTPRIRFFITHQSELYLADIQDKLSELYGLPTTLRQHGENVWRLQAQNTEQNKNFLSEIFGINLSVFNDQKYRITLNYLSKYYVLQASGELLESPYGPISSQGRDVSLQGSETTGEVVNPLNTRLKRPKH